MKQKKEKIEFVRHDALEEEVQKNKKVDLPKGSDLTVKVDPEQAQQWF